MSTAGFVNKIRGSKDYSPSAGASSSSLTMVSISPDFSPVLAFTKKYFMKTFGAVALGAPCLLSKSNPSNMGEDGLGIVCVVSDDELNSADIIIETFDNGKDARRQIMDVYSKWSQETFGMYVEPYMCDFVDEYIANTVQKDTRNQMRLIEIFMLLAVMISLLGLVAMSTYFSESQSKDIAVRKVYGGTVGSETVRYVSNYMAMVLTASVIGIPLAVWAAHLYLRRFTYRIEDWWWIPVVAVLISLGISLCAVLWQTLRAAHTDPAKALKKE